MESAAVGAASGGGAELETSQPPPRLPGSRSDLAVWKRKVFPSLQRERETLWFKARENWHTVRERGRLIQRWRLRKTEGERVRVTSRGLISEANHFELQRESPGWKISEQEEKDSKKTGEDGE